MPGVPVGRILALAAAAWLAVRLLRRRGAAVDDVVVVGYADGSSLRLEQASTERDRLVVLGRTALTR